MTDPALQAIFPLCPNSKVPTEDAKAWQYTKPGDWTGLTQYGVNLPPDILVVDADPRNYRNGINSLAMLHQLVNIPASYTVRTPRGGVHIYLRKPADLKIRHKLKELPGIDFRSVLQYVVGPGSHSEFGEYVLALQADIAQAPQKLLDLLEAPEMTLLSSEALWDENAATRYTEYAKTVEPAISGQGGNNHTYLVAAHGLTMGVPEQTCYEILSEHFNNRCLPPWPANELQNLVKHAYRYGRDTAGAGTAASAFKNVKPPEQENISDLQQYKKARDEGLLAKVEIYYYKDGRPRPTLSNAIEYLNLDSLTKDNLKFNSFKGKMEFDTPPPFIGDDNRVNDGAVRQLRTIWSRKYGFEISDKMMLDALYVYSSRRTYHPIVDYFESLTWDKKERLPYVLHYTLGVKDALHTRAVSELLFLSATARIVYPGCKQDYMIVLESDQGFKKSQWVENLVPDPDYTTALLSLDPKNKDTWINMAGKWIIEIPELNAVTSRTDANMLKNLLSVPKDTYRKPYEREADDFKRQSIFVATINPGPVGYLKDITGNRRFFPIQVNSVDLNVLIAMRDQLWAEAYHKIKNGVKWWIEDKDILATLKMEQDRRFERDPMQDMVADYIVKAGSPQAFSFQEVVAGLQLPPSQLRTNDKRRMYAAFEKYGYIYNFESRKYEKK